jgi:predicted amidophosphoribosyltransferase
MGERQSETFVWPPRTVVRVEVPPPDKVQPARDAASRPMPLVEIGTDAPPAATVPGRGGAIVAPRPVDPGEMPACGRSTWAEIERVWLGVVSPPFARRAAEAGWRPDEPGAYCPNCVRTAGAFEVRDGVCARCAAEPRTPWDRAVRLGVFDGFLRDVVHDVKFTRWHALGRQAGRALGEAVGRELQAAGVEGRVVVVPTPTTLRRRLARGIDHAGSIALGVGQALGAPVVGAVGRAHRPSQLAVPPSERAENVAGAFHPRRAGRRLGAGRKVIVVVDDVMTTGATMRGVCRAVRAGRRTDEKTGKDIVWAAVLARAGERG